MAGLYIHIPFCERRCNYCDFYSATSTELTGALLGALKREMASRRNFFPIDGAAYSLLGAAANDPTDRAANGGPLDTIYIGGGTPTMLAPGDLNAILHHAAALWDCSGVREITLEANPEDLTDEYLDRLSRDTGQSPAGTRTSPCFNRLSIGVQSFDDGLLRKMNRRHSAARARQAVADAQRAGFGNITIDLIFGIPGMSAGQWERTLDEAIGLGVQHISAYHLTIEPGTAFGRMAQKGTIRPIPEAESERQFELLRTKLADAGFEHYEISNFALTGRRAIHNSAYWSGEPYLGVGPSAHSYDGRRRREWVARDIGRYIAAFSVDGACGNADGIYDGETLSDTDIRNERIMTGLRTADGIDAGELTAPAVSLPAAAGISVTGKSDPVSDRERVRDEIVNKLVSEGLLIEKNGRRRIPADKLLLSDYIIASLFE